MEYHLKKANLFKKVRIAEQVLLNSIDLSIEFQRLEISFF